MALINTNNKRLLSVIELFGLNLQYDPLNILTVNTVSQKVLSAAPLLKRGHHSWKHHVLI